MELEAELLVEPDAENADSLISSNDPDDMVNEQTWPTEDEMQGAHFNQESDDLSIPDAQKGTTPKAVKKIPKGMSEYQAAWIIDESDEEDEENQEQDDEGMAEDKEEMVELPVKEDEAEMETNGRKSVTFQDLDLEEEDRQ